MFFTDVSTGMATLKTGGASAVVPQGTTKLILPHEMLTANGTAQSLIGANASQLSSAGHSTTTTLLISNNHHFYHNASSFHNSSSLFNTNSNSSNNSNTSSNSHDINSHHLRLPNNTSFNATSIPSVSSSSIINNITNISKNTNHIPESHTTIMNNKMHNITANVTSTISSQSTDNKTNNDVQKDGAIEDEANETTENEQIPESSSDVVLASSEPVEEDPEIDIVINNVVCSFSVRCHLNLRTIALNGYNVEFRRENGMVTMKLRKPYTTASIWSSGKITCTGATSEDNVSDIFINLTTYS